MRRNFMVNKLLVFGGIIHRSSTTTLTIGLTPNDWRLPPENCVLQVAQVILLHLLLFA